MPELTRVLLEAKVTGIAYETIETVEGGHPLLAPMSEVAGKMAVQAGRLQAAGTLLNIRRVAGLGERGQGDGEGGKRAGGAEGFEGVAALHRLPSPQDVLKQRHGSGGLAQLVEANILGTHAFQVALARKEGRKHEIRALSRLHCAHPQYEL